MQLPVQAAVAGKWQLWDYQVKRLRTPVVAGADGKMAVELQQVPDNELWLVDRIRVSSTSVIKSQVYLYENDATSLENVIDGSLSGNFDVADNASPILLVGGIRLVFQWEGAEAGSLGFARVQWTILRPVAVV